MEREVRRRGRCRANPPGRRQARQHGAAARA